MPEVEFPINDSGMLLIPGRVRERYLTPDVEQAVVQSTGMDLNIWVNSSRSNIRITIPLSGWRAEKPIIRKLDRWLINVTRWLEPGGREPSVKPTRTGRLRVQPNQTDDGVTARGRVQQVERGPPDV